MRQSLESCKCRIVAAETKRPVNSRFKKETGNWFSPQPSSFNEAEEPCVVVMCL